ncbi:MAG: formylmethanofuran--tetrahydromethanopterin N-formyltransferase, partial [Gemmataceae bacterium]
VLDGLDQVAVESAMRAGILAACTHRTALVQITAGNYGGKLGPVHFPLRTLLKDYADASL